MFGDLNLEVVFTTLAPPSTPATGVNWARKASRNIGATFIARMQPPVPQWCSRVLISQDGHHVTLSVSQMPRLPQTHDIHQQVPADTSLLIFITILSNLPPSVMITKPASGGDEPHAS